MKDAVVLQTDDLDGLEVLKVEFGDFTSHSIVTDGTTTTGTTTTETTTTGTTSEATLTVSFIINFISLIVIRDTLLRRKKR